MKTTQTALSPVHVGVLGSTGFPALSQDDDPAGLIMDGNPPEDLGAVTGQENLKIIMKNGKIYKNTLQ